MYHDDLGPFCGPYTSASCWNIRITRSDYVTGYFMYAFELAGHIFNARARDSLYSHRVHKHAYYCRPRCFTLPGEHDGLARRPCKTTLGFKPSVSPCPTISFLWWPFKGFRLCLDARDLLAQTLRTRMDFPGTVSLNVPRDTLEDSLVKYNQVGALQRENLFLGSRMLGMLKCLARKSRTCGWGFNTCPCDHVSGPATRSLRGFDPDDLAQNLDDDCGWYCYRSLKDSFTDEASCLMRSTTRQE